MANSYTNHKGIKSAFTHLPSKQEEYRDSTTKGLYLRIYASGTGHFIHRYKMGGKRRVFTYGHTLSTKSSEKEIATTLSKVRGEHAEKKEFIASGVDIALERDLAMMETKATPTVRDFASTYIERYAKPKKKTWEGDKRFLDVDVVPALGDLKIRDVKRAHIIALLDRKQDAGALVTRNRLISLLSKFFNFALERGHIEFNPVAGIKRTREKPRDRVLTDNEIRLFWNWTETSQSEPVTVLALRLALITGQRIGEICAMQESHIEGDIWTKPDTKNGLPHAIPLTQTALEVINQLRPHSRNGYLVVNTKGKAKTNDTFSQAMAKSGIQWDLEPVPTPHDLRRTLTTGIRKLGFNRLVQDKVTNHKDNSVGGIYDRNDYMKEKRQALEAWERELHRILGHTEVSNIVPFKTA